MGLYGTVNNFNLNLFYQIYILLKVRKYLRGAILFFCLLNNVLVYYLKQIKIILHFFKACQKSDFLYSEQIVHCAFVFYIARLNTLVDVH